MIKLSIGGFFGKFKELAAVLLLREDHPEWFRPGVVIDSTFDSWPNVVWNGGRYRFDVPYPVAAMRRDLDFFNRRGIGVRFTYTNSLLEPRHMGDVLGNLTLELAHREPNAVIVASPVLEAHVRRHFPRYQIIASCTLDELSGPVLTGRALEVDLLVLPPDLNRRRKLIRRIGPQRLEILVNERCRPGCVDRKEHYRDISRNILLYDVSKQRDPLSALPAACVFRPGTAAHEARRSATCEFPLSMAWAEVEAMHHELGVEHFKVGGRDLARHIFVRDLTEYLVQEEHQLAFSQAMDECLHSGAYKRLLS